MRLESLLKTLKQLELEGKGDLEVYMKIGNGFSIPIRNVVMVQIKDEDNHVEIE